MTAPQPATPRSDSVHAQIAEVLLAAYASVRDDELPMSTECWTARLAEFVMRSGWVDRLRAEAKAEALEEAAEELDATSQLLWDEYKGGDPAGPHRASTYTEGTVAGFDASEQRLRARAAAYRTNPSSEETDRGR